MCRFSFHDIDRCHCVQSFGKKSRRPMCIFSTFHSTAKFIVLLFLGILLFRVPSSGGSSSTDGEPDGIHIASWNWGHVGVFITVTGFIVFSGLAKVGMKIFAFIQNYRDSILFSKISMLLMLYP